jgi:hypothetical protein
MNLRRKGKLKGGGIEGRARAQFIIIIMLVSELAAFPVCRDGG